MSKFVGRSACRGIAPKFFGAGLIERNELINKMMKNRLVPRLIVAPNGFGKSVLAAQYANLTLNFKDTFWIDCTSPCFIRDIDSGDLFKDLLSYKGHAKLVIFDDLPELDKDRLKVFSGGITKLLKSKMEVIITTSPNKCSENDLADCLTINHKDLFITTREIKNSNAKASSSFVSAQEGSVMRIACMCTPSVHPQIILKNFISETSSTKALFVVFVVYLYSYISKKTMQNLLGEELFKLAQKIEEEYGILGFDGTSFNVPVVQPKYVYGCFNKNIKDFAKVMGDKNKDLTTKEASNEIALKILATFKGATNERVIEIVRLMCTDEVKVLFTKTNFAYCLQHVLARDLLKLIASISSAIVQGDVYCMSIKAILWALCNKIYSAKKLSFNVLEMKNATTLDKVLVIFVFLIYGHENEFKHGLNICAILQNEITADDKISSLTKTLVSFIVEGSKDVNSSIAFLMNNKIKNENLRFSMYMFAIRNLKRHGIENVSSKLLLEFIKHVEQLLPTSEDVTKNIYAYLFMKECISIRSSLKAYFDLDCFVLTQPREIALKNVERRIYIEDKSKEPSERIDMQNDEEEAETLSIKKAATRNSIKVCVFGGLSILTPDNENVGVTLRRQKSRTLLTILAIENGKEISRDKLAAII